MSKSLNPLPIIGYACGIGAGNIGTEAGPFKLQATELAPQEMEVHWQQMLVPKHQHQGLAALEDIREISQRLAQISENLIDHGKFFMTIGGDHTCAIGTWSGVAAAIKPKKLGLLWIDAHLDSHTPKTTPSGNIHGMPLAVLLGQGDQVLTQLNSISPKILPENLCIIGIRSYEKAEQALLESLNVKIFYMADIQKKGFAAIFQEAIAHIKQHSDCFGISLDLDAIDPTQAPGVGSPASDGIDSDELLQAIHSIAEEPRLLAFEIAEFNPQLDQGQKTEKIMIELLGKFQSRG